MTDADKEILKRVYQDELDSLKLQLAAALDARTENELALMDAQRRHTNTVYRHAVLQGRVDALKELAAKDGVTLQ